MVGFFPGYKMPYHAVNKIASRVWRQGGLEYVTAIANGFIIFRFNTEENMHAILEKGPWMFGGKTSFFNNGIPVSNLTRIRSPHSQFGFVYMVCLFLYGLSKVWAWLQVWLEGHCPVMNKHIIALGWSMQGYVLRLMLPNHSSENLR